MKASKKIFAGISAVALVAAIGVPSAFALGGYGNGACDGSGNGISTCTSSICAHLNDANSTSAGNGNGTGSSACDGTGAGNGNGACDGTGAGNGNGVCNGTGAGNGSGNGACGMGHHGGC